MTYNFPNKRFFLIAAVSLLVSVSFVGCKKEAGTEQNNFEVNGVTDLTANSNGYNSFRMYVVQISGIQERVNFSSQDLPYGIAIEYNPMGGVPDFDTYIKVNVGDTVESGSYNCKVVAKSESKTKVYEFKIKVPPFSFVTLNGLRHKTSTSVKYLASGITLTSAAYSSKLTAAINVIVPEGKSIYPLDGSLLAPSNAIVFDFRDSYGRTYSLKDNSGKVATINKDGDSITIEIPEVELSNNINQKLLFGGYFIQ